MSMHTIRRALCTRKMTREVYLSTPPVGYSGSLSTVNDPITITKRILINFKNSYELISNSRSAIHCSVLDGESLQLVSLIRGVDDFSERQQLENRIEVSQTHFCLICSRWDTIVLGIFSFPRE